MIPLHSKVFRLGLIWALIFSPLLYLSQSVQAQRAANPVPLPGPITQSLHPPVEAALSPEAILRTPEMRAFVDTQHRVRDAVFGDNLEPTLWWEVDSETIGTGFLVLETHHGEAVYLIENSVYSDDAALPGASGESTITSAALIRGDILPDSQDNPGVAAEVFVAELLLAGGEQVARAIVLDAEFTDANRAPRSCYGFGEMCDPTGGGAEGICLTPCDDFDNPNALACVQFGSSGPSICRELALEAYRTALESAAMMRDASIYTAMMYLAAAAAAACGIAVILAVTPLGIIAAGGCAMVAAYAMYKARQAAIAKYHSDIAAARQKLYDDLKRCCDSTP